MKQETHFCCILCYSIMAVIFLCSVKKVIPIIYKNPDTPNKHKKNCTFKGMLLQVAKLLKGHKAEDQQLKCVFNFSFKTNY